MSYFIKKHKSMIISGLACLTLGMLSGYFTKSSDYAWLATLHKPWFNPPNWVFAPVWTILYIMMGFAINKIWHSKAKQRKLPVIMFIIQFIFNLAWSPIFFHKHRIDLALYDISLLWLSLIILIFILWYRKIKSAFFLLLPYILWVSFALALNFSIYQLN